MTPLNWPLMQNNIVRQDLDALIEFLKQDDPILTQSKNVRAFEEEWSRWLGAKHSVFVNSGASANLVTMTALKHLYGPGEVIVPTLTWVSDVSSVLINGFKPVFVDIDDKTLGMDVDQVISKINKNTRAVFLTHVLGLNGLDDRLIEACEKHNVPLIEDVCESHGATHKGQKLGAIGHASNFSFYYAHHMSTIEGGVVCTNDLEFYETVRMLRSHGMTREISTPEIRERWIKENPHCNPEFIFSYPAFNVRSTELNAVIGRNQLKRLDENNKKRVRNFRCFLENLDKNKYRTDFFEEGSVNYAFILVQKNPDLGFCERLMATMRAANVEFRRGLSGGGNQLRQPFLRGVVEPSYHKEFPKVEHVHNFGFYIGNYPDLTEDRIKQLCALLNSVN
jgi:CDP-6-deoxy-D-xylo-4-hexulose-3-dehydrase